MNRVVAAYVVSLSDPGDFLHDLEELPHFPTPIPERVGTRRNRLRKVTHATDGDFAADFALMRVPMLAIGNIARWTDDAAGDRDLLRKGFAELLADPTVASALAFGSTDIGDGLRHWRSDPTSKRGRAAERSLVAYISRMAGRPTPFGPLASYARAAIDGPARLDIGDRESLRIVTRIDPGLLQRLVAEAAAESALNQASQVRTNPLAHRHGNRVRVPAHVGTTNSRTLVALVATPAMVAVIEAAQDGATIGQLQEIVANNGENPVKLLEKLVRRDVLVPIAAVSVIGDDPTTQALRVLQTLPSPKLYDAVAAASAAATAGNDARSASSDVRRCLREAGHESPYRRTLQVDTIRPGDIHLPPLVVHELRRAALLIAEVSPLQHDPLKQFRETFARRFGTRPVPLLEALDPDIGVRLDDEAGASEEAPAIVQRRRRALQTLLHRGVSSPDGEVELTDDDIAALTSPRSCGLPSAFAVLGSLVATDATAVDRGSFQVWSPSISGPGGGRLVGRFCHGDDFLAEATRAHFAFEAAAVPDDLFAEIAVAPDVDWGLNVTHRPHLREFEIDLGGSSMRPGVLPPSDLLLTVDDDQLVLWSGRHGHRVRPRSATALNRQWLAVPVARFLSLLADTELTSHGWWWGEADDAPFLPRVRRGRVVLSPRQWSRPAHEVLGLGGAGLLAAVRTWRDGLSIPRWVHTKEAKGPVLVDLENPLMIESVLAESKRQLTIHPDAVVRLSEAVPPEELPVRGPDGSYAHELLMAFSSRKPAARTATHTKFLGAPCDRSFLPGSPWLFAKIYGPASAQDRLLTDRIGPLIASLRMQHVIDRWFFIRYADPDQHLRIRLHGAPDALTVHALPQLHEAIANAVRDGDAFMMSLDTYDRELERYGGTAGTDAMEAIAEADSDAVLALLQLGAMAAPNRADIAVLSLLTLFEDSGLPTNRRDECARGLRDSFTGRLTPEGQRELGREFRSRRGRLAALMEDHGASLQPNVPAVFSRRSSAQIPVFAALAGADKAGNLSPSRDELVQSLAHMALNRLLRDGGGIGEARAHDALARLYLAQAARKGDGQ